MAIMKKLKYLLPSILWMIFIFMMSHTNGNESSNQSNFIATIISKFVDIDHEVLTFLIRKTAHMSEYAILLLLIFYGLEKISTYKYKLSLSLLITFLYACSDEFHQLFIPGRSGQLKDVIIDISGALIMLFVIYLWKKRKTNQ